MENNLFFIVAFDDGNTPVNVKFSGATQCLTALRHGARLASGDRCRLLEEAERQNATLMRGLGEQHPPQQA